MKFFPALFISLLFTACSAPEKPVFKSLKNVKFNGFSIVKPYSVTLNADVIYFNPNSLSADITEMDFDVFINEKKATHITQELRAKMPAKSDFILPIKVTIPLQEIFEDVKFKDILKSRTVIYELKGNFKMGIGNALIKVPFNYTGKESLGF
jgi:LEA14-like dessication related protein